jgi:hypothetical protein
MHGGRQAASAGQAGGSLGLHLLQALQLPGCSLRGAAGNQCALL